MRSQLINVKLIMDENNEFFTLISNNIVHWGNYAHRDGLR